MEAVFGAVYLDQGLEAAAEMIRRLFAALLDDLATRRASLDYKTSLQELTAAQLASLPVYELSEEGPDHEKRFTARVLVDDEPMGLGEGRSKKEAEQAAAQQAYAELQRRMAVGSAPSEGGS
jgi:ribonuclease III